MEPGLLLIPGPVPLPPRVLEEFSKPAMPHYGDAWVKAHAETQELLRYVWAAPDAHVFPIAGPGHAGLEACGSLGGGAADGPEVRGVIASLTLGLSLASVEILASWPM